MSVGGISGSSRAYLLGLQQQADATNGLFGGTAVGDVGSLTPTAAAYGLYENPALLQNLTQWDGTTTPGSERTATATAPTGNTSGVQPDYSFDPFDQASWDVAPKGSLVDTTA